MTNKWVVFGKAPFDKNKLKNYNFSEYNTICVNDTFVYYPEIKFDYIIFSDFSYKHLFNIGYDVKYIFPKSRSIIKYAKTHNKLNLLHYEYNKDTKICTDNTKKNLCCCPYTGLAGINYAIKQNADEILLVGFDFGENHNYINGVEQKRNKDKANIYRQQKKEFEDICYNKNIRLILGANI